ncbi:homeobox-leucine zipper protein HAT22-like [Humulus lupulus]|uniref:homeobox-leucine zipper protein HAT22-like n=1 Tax=Humulus lupulus TaxID=3486 RepID=UPI002B40B325|nr:homeobox-leucine zipper protein HAT22-like [Humulus lupulus]
MGFDDLCNTGLDLGLGFTASAASTKKPSTNSTTTSATTTSFEPSLTLGLSGDPYNSSNNARKISTINIDVNKGGGTTCHEETVNNNNSNNNIDLYRQASPHSAVSSFSGGGGRVKRERDLSSEEIEVEKVSSRISDEDDDGPNARKKLRLTKEQSALLEESFKQHSTLNPRQKQALARQLNLRPRQVEVWFQNRRARTKLKQTEVDCEFLKKCCETLTDENRRLQKELQELKALKLSQPLYMHMPAATLTMCPSCERIGGVGVGAGDGASKSPFSMASKPHFYNPFTNPSAAC